MYYPKSQIKTNLYTNGNEFSLSTTNESYKGYYYEISTGQQYTGKNPQDGPNILLNLSTDGGFTFTDREVIPFAQISTIQTSDYTPINVPTFRSIPQFNLTLPTDQDKINGQFTRYFCKKNNEIKYLEINQDTFKKLQIRDSQIAWDLYTPVQVIWIISGNQTQVFTSNKGTVQTIENTLQWTGFTQYFQDKFLKYYLGS
jgi:hypothetical protein